MKGSNGETLWNSLSRWNELDERKQRMKMSSENE